jgi:hypothetical protein
MDNITTTSRTETFTNRAGEICTYEIKEFIAPITVNGETREVTFRGYDSLGSYTSDSIFAGRIGRGAKRHRGSARAYFFDSVEIAAKKGYKINNLILVDNQIVGINQTVMFVRNTHAAITGWADEVAGTAQATKQKYYGGF